MALNPQYLDSLPEALVEMYSMVEGDILKDMARRISEYDYFIPAAMHQNQKMRELGLTQEYILKALAGMTGRAQAEIVDLLTEASEAAIEDDVEYYKAADVYKPDEIDAEALYKQLNGGLLQTEQAFKNITRTTANTATKQFERALDRAWMQINMGGMDYNTAIQRAVKDLAQAGVGAIEYPSGRVDSLEVAVRRAVVTGANQTSLKVQEALEDELEVELVETTAHGGARSEHARWQGKVFSRNGRKTIDGVTYEDLRRATGYGTGAGLGGWNCRHAFHPYIPGAARAYGKKQLEEYNAKKIEYNGRKYTEYEASQIQRGIERKIRSLKRQVSALEAGGCDASAERKKLREAQKSYTDFTKQTGLKKQPARTKIETGTGTEKAASAKVIDMAAESDIIKGKRALTRFVNSSEPLYKNAQNIEPIDDFEDIVIHGNKEGFGYKDKDGKEYFYTVREFAAILKESNTYNGGNIRLISCETGAEGANAAQMLANQLGVKVMAPTDVVWIYPDGRITIGPTEFENTGEWKVFTPKG